MRLHQAEIESVSAKLSAMAVQPVRPMDDQGTEIAADRLILRRASASELTAFVQALPSGLAARCYAAVLSTEADISRNAIPEPPLTLGSYFAARLTARGGALLPQAEACMYALADAVRTSSAIEVMRWQMVLASMPMELRWTGTSARLLHQSRRALRTLVHLSDSQSLQQEMRVLQLLRARR